VVTGGSHREGPTRPKQPAGLSLVGRHLALPG